MLERRPEYKAYDIDADSIMSEEEGHFIDTIMEEWGCECYETEKTYTIGRIVELLKTEHTSIFSCWELKAVNALHQKNIHREIDDPDAEEMGDLWGNFIQAVSKIRKWHEKELRKGIDERERLKKAHKELCKKIASREEK